MSTLNVANITDGTDTVATGYVVNGSAKAWVNFNGTGTIAVRDSMNVSSLTDNGAADYAVNFGNNMANTSYAFQLANNSNVTTFGAIFGGFQWANDVKSTSTIEAHFVYQNASNGGSYEPSEVNYLIHGDLA